MAPELEASTDSSQSVLLAPGMCVCHITPLDLLDAQRQIRKSKLDVLKAQGDAQSRLAAIERILGEDL